MTSGYVHDLLLFHTVTPLHVGCGQDVGVVDLPVIRERTTGLPFLPGSGTRGALRARLELARSARPAPDERWVGERFGPADWDDGDQRYAGSVAVHDAKLLLFPVRSDREVFVWLTCPAVLARLAAELEVFAPARRELGWRPGHPPGDEEALAAEEVAGAAGIHLEEIAFQAAAGPTAGDRAGLAEWAGRLGGLLDLPDLARRLVLVSDPSFAYFCRFATGVQQHNRLNSAKTVERGGLFSVEAVPPAAVFWGFFGATEARWWPGEEGRPDGAAVAAEVRAALLGDSGRAVLHLGGGESTGMGVTELYWLDGRSA